MNRLKQINTNPFQNQEWLFPEINQDYLFPLDKNVQCQEASHTTYFKIETLIKAEEVFITNSLMEIMPVSMIEDNKIGKIVPGKITQQIMNAYKSLI